MALLEAMLLHQQEEDPFMYGNGSNSKDLYTLSDATATATCHQNHQHQHPSCGGLHGISSWDANCSSPEIFNTTGDGFLAAAEAAGGCPSQPPATIPGRRKRRRTKTLKNQQELENQRMTHINVERNRRKQMNQYLAALRSLMPPTYVQRGDQGSIVGGAINYVKELEHLLQTLESEGQINLLHRTNNISNSIFSDKYSSEEEKVAVTMVEGYANVKVRLRRRAKQAVKNMVLALHSLQLTVLHLNVTTLHLHVLYSFTLKIEDDCELASVKEVAAAMHDMVARIDQEEEN